MAAGGEGLRRKDVLHHLLPESGVPFATFMRDSAMTALFFVWLNHWNLLGYRS
jgi:hypothetical protein